MQSAARCLGNPLSNPLWGSRRLGYRIVATPTSGEVGGGLGCRMAPTMAKKKGVRIIVTLECTEARGEGGTPSRYVTQKNRRNTSQRLELKKYNKYLRRYTLHREIK